MGKFLKWIWRLITDAAQAWTIWLWLAPPAVVSAMTAYWANYINEPWHLVIFYSSGVLCFLLLAFCCIYWFVTVSSVWGKIRFQDFTILQVGPTPALPLVGFNSCGYIYNNSNHDIYVQTIELAYSLQNKTRAGPFVKPSPFIVHSKTSTSILLPTVTEVDSSKPINGWLKLKLVYGKSKEKMNYTYLIEGTPMVTLTITGNAFHYTSNMSIENIEYD